MGTESIMRRAPGAWEGRQDRLGRRNARRAARRSARRGARRAARSTRVVWRLLSIVAGDKG